MNGKRNRQRVLVTGSTGLVGKAACQQLLDRGYSVRACIQKPEGAAQFGRLREGIEFCCTGDIGQKSDWSKELEGVDAVLHLAARVHQVQDRTPDLLECYRRMNVVATERLAQAAAKSARRFVFVSSIKVNGEQTIAKPFDELDIPSPQEPYAVSKWEAENVLRRLATTMGLEVVVIRPPLVYGPGVKANFLSMMRAIYKGLPLPLPNFQNRRSLVGVGNLVNLLVECLDHPSAANRTFLVSDGEDVSTRELASRIARAFGRSCHFLPFPASAMRLAARVLHKQAHVARLFGSLAVNSNSVREHLGWQPPYTLDDGLSATAQWFVNSTASAH